MPSALGHQRAGSEQHERNQGDSVWAAVGVAARGEDQFWQDTDEEFIETFVGTARSRSSSSQGLPSDDVIRRGACAYDRWRNDGTHGGINGAGASESPRATRPE